jgi:hypothetical protein
MLNIDKRSDFKMAGRQVSEVHWQRQNGQKNGNQTRGFGSPVQTLTTIYPVAGGQLIVNEENHVPVTVQGNGDAYDVNFYDSEPMLRAKDDPKQAKRENCPLTFRFTDPVSAAGFYLSLDGQDEIYDGQSLVSARVYAELADGNLYICDSHGTVDRTIPDGRTITAPFIGAKIEGNERKIAKLFVDATSHDAYFSALLVSRMYWFA